MFLYQSAVTIYIYLCIPTTSFDIPYSLYPLPYILYLNREFSIPNICYLTVADAPTPHSGSSPIKRSGPFLSSSSEM